MISCLKLNLPQIVVATVFEVRYTLFHIGSSSAAIHFTILLLSSCINQTRELLLFPVVGEQEGGV